MPIDSKECFAALTEDGQLWEIYQAAQTGGGGITSINGDTTAAQLISGTAPITASTAAGTTTISTSMNTARLLGRTTAGVGVAEEITVGTGLSLAGGTLTNTVTAGVTSVTATAPLTSSGGATPDISTSIATNKVVGRSTVGTGVMEQLTPVGITVSAGNITGIGGTVGTVDNAVPRADGTGGYTAQGSDIIIDDATTSTQNNIAIRNDHSGQANSSLVLTPKGTGALIAGPKPDGTATGGNARGARAVDLQLIRNAATQVASGADSVAIGSNSTASSVGAISLRGNASGLASVAIAGVTASGVYSVAIAGENALASGTRSVLVCGYYSSVSADNATGIASVFSTSNANYSVHYGLNALSNRYGMHAHSNGSFAGGSTATGDAQRARFVLRCKTTTNAAVEMTLDGATPGAANRLTIPAGKYLTGTINIAGIKSDGATAASYIRQFSIKHISATATTSLVGTVNTVGVDEAAGTTISITANDTNDALKVDVTGITSETWRWVAAVDVVEVGYGT